MQNTDSALRDYLGDKRADMTKIKYPPTSGKKALPENLF
jgi:hypothetical protein